MSLAQCVAQHAMKMPARLSCCAFAAGKDRKTSSTSQGVAEAVASRLVFRAALLRVSAKLTGQQTALAAATNPCRDLRVQV